MRMLHPPRTTRRRDFLLAISLGVATCVLQFVPTRKPTVDVARTQPEGLAASALVDMSLLNLIDDQFAEELPAFKSPSGRPIVRWREDRSLALIECGDGFIRGFRRVQAAIDPETGGKAIIFEEVDASRGIEDIAQLNPAKLTAIPGGRVRILFPGLSDAGDAISSRDKAAVHDILNGARSPQLRFVERFLKTAAIPYLAAKQAAIGTPCDVEIFGHSLGAPNALYAKDALNRCPHVAYCDAILFEPLGAAGEASFILNEANEGGHALQPSAILDRLARHVATVRAYPPTLASELYAGNRIANEGFGDSYYVIDHGYWSDPQMRGKAIGLALIVGMIALVLWLSSRGTAIASRNAIPHVSKSKPLSAATLFIVAAISSQTIIFLTGKAVQADNDWAHDTAANACQLYAARDRALIQCDKDTLPTLEELRTPKAFVSWQPQLHVVRRFALWKTSR